MLIESGEIGLLSGLLLRFRVEDGFLGMGTIWLLLEMMELDFRLDEEEGGERVLESGLLEPSPACSKSELAPLPTEPDSNLPLSVPASPFPEIYIGFSSIERILLWNSSGMKRGPDPFVRSLHEFFKTKWLLSFFPDYRTYTIDEKRSDYLSLKKSLSKLAFYNFSCPGFISRRTPTAYPW